jgi:hypothetical protein
MTQNPDTETAADNYRRTYLAELTDTSEAAGHADRTNGPATPAAALDTLREPDLNPARRDDALTTLGATADADPERISEMLALLAEPGTAIETRLGLLTALQQISFRGVLFPGVRPEYLETLRGLIEDPDRTLRRRAIGVLAREQDPYVQQRLLAGLEHREPELVPAAKAIQFLGYDMHAEYAPLLRRIVADPPSLAARKEALRLLAADPAATDLLADVLADRDERPDVRATAAVALQAAAPDRFAALARGIAMDDEEADDIRAVAVTGLSLAESGDPEETATRQLTDHLADLRDNSPSKNLRQAADGSLSARER